MWKEMTKLLKNEIRSKPKRIKKEIMRKRNEEINNERTKKKVKKNGMNEVPNKANTERMKEKKKNKKECRNPKRLEVDVLNTTRHNQPITFFLKKKKYNYSYKYQQVHSQYVSVDM